MIYFSALHLKGCRTLFKISAHDFLRTCKRHRDSIGIPQCVTATVSQECLFSISEIDGELSAGFQYRDVGTFERTESEQLWFVLRFRVRLKKVTVCLCLFWFLKVVSEGFCILCRWISSVCDIKINGHMYVKFVDKRPLNAIRQSSFIWKILTILCLLSLDCNKNVLPFFF